MFSKHFSNQTVAQVLSHLKSLLDPELRYNISVDPLGVRVFIEESTAMSRSEKKKIRSEKTMRHRIRSRKKGRTVNLKGRDNF